MLHYNNFQCHHRNLLSNPHPLLSHHTKAMQSFAAAQHNHLKAFVQIVSVNYLWHSHKKHGTLALVVELLETRQAAQHCEAILAGVSSTTGILSQPEHSETCQWTQMRELGE